MKGEREKEKEKRVSQCWVGTLSLGGPGWACPPTTVDWVIDDAVMVPLNIPGEWKQTIQANGMDHAQLRQAISGRTGERLGKARQTRLPESALVSQQSRKSG